LTPADSGCRKWRPYPGSLQQTYAAVYRRLVGRQFVKRRG